MHAKSLQPCPSFHDPVDCSPPGSSLHVILQPRILKWIAIPSSRDKQCTNRVFVFVFPSNTLMPADLRNLSWQMVVNVTINKTLFTFRNLYSNNIWWLSPFFLSLNSFIIVSFDSLISIYLFILFFSSIFMQELGSSGFSFSWINTDVKNILG